MNGAVVAWAIDFGGNEVYTHSWNCFATIDISFFAAFDTVEHARKPAIFLKVFEGFTDSSGLFMCAPKGQGITVHDFGCTFEEGKIASVGAVSNCEE